MRKLKKYPNRRIYDTEESRYITLADVREMVLKRQSFKVVDSRDERDLTRSVLLQIIADLEAEGHESLLTNRVLEELIRFYGDRSVEVLGPFVEKQFVALLEQQDRIRGQLRQFSSGLRGAASPPVEALKNLPTPDKFFREMSDQYLRFFQNFVPERNKKGGDETNADSKEDDRD